MQRAACTGFSIFISDEGTRDGAYGHTPDFGGDLLEKFDLYWERSPLKYAKNVKTPTLILHSVDDQVWPYENAEELHGLIRGSKLVPLRSRNHILQFPH